MKRLIHIFDIDDTMIHSDAKVVIHDYMDNEVLYLSSSEYNQRSNEFTNATRYSVIFEQFNSLEQLKYADTLPMFKVFKAMYHAGLDIAIITSREDPVLISTWLAECHNIILPKTRIHCINRHRASNKSKEQSDAELKKDAIISLYKTEGFDTFIVYDDCLEFNEAMESAMADVPILVIPQSHFLTIPRP